MNLILAMLIGVVSFLMIVLALVMVIYRMVEFEKRLKLLEEGEE